MLDALRFPMLRSVVVVLSPVLALAQSEVLLEGFEFATSDAAAAAGVIDLTDFSNSPAFFIGGDEENATEGLFSIGTDAVFCQVFCEPGSFIGFRRGVDPERFPTTCPGGAAFAPLQSTYGDPAHPGPVPPDYALDELNLFCDAYGDGAFADGPTGTHFWVNLVDCEGEVFEFVNHSEPSLNSKIWTFNVAMGQSLVRLSPDSLVEVPNGDRLLTEVVAVEVLIQDADTPPTTFGKWYIDNLRIVEPGELAVAAVGSRHLEVTLPPGTDPVAVWVTGDPNDLAVSCIEGYVQADGRLAPNAVFLTPTEWGRVLVADQGLRPATTYLVQLDRGTPGAPVLSPALSATTWVYGDVDGNGIADLDDVLCILDTIAGTASCSGPALDVGPCAPDDLVDLYDLVYTMDGFANQPFGCDEPCDSSACADGSVFLFTPLQGTGTGASDYRLQIDRERFRVDVFGGVPGSHAVTLNGTAVGQIFIGGDGTGELEYDSNDGTLPPGFPDVAVHDVVGVGSFLMGTLELDCP